jgi:F-type H+-transporting ATPase subunit b
MNGLQIDPFTTAAQIINFLILLYLLQRLLYRPVIKLMEEREMLISSRLKEAEDKRTEAEREAESYRQKKEEISSEHEEMLIRAKEDARSFKEELLKEARREVDDKRAEWYRDSERERREFLVELRKRAGEQIYAISRRALRDLADEDLEARIIDTFIGRLKSLEESEKDAIAELYRSLKQPITVRSTFEIPEEKQRKIVETLRDQAKSELVVQFQIDDELISGIEMSAGNLEISWNIGNYLDSLEADFRVLLEEKTPGKRPG